ncbi:hypothetical protein HD554DRAFT_2045866 [Boletus coccyginus]|nr:hypothetical protein HD554DRAFT_2045866 [Boletus coccyginus]
MLGKLLWSSSYHTLLTKGWEKVQHQLGVTLIYIVEWPRQTSPGCLGPTLAFSQRDIMSLGVTTDLFVSKSRIFWCSTSPFVFLPIHAASFYDTWCSKPGHKVSDFVVSSYVPTLSILAPPPDSNVAPSGDLRLLTVHQPPSDGLPHLPGVATELRHIREIIGNSPAAHVVLLESSTCTVEEVLVLMFKEAEWVHFACHGIQDAADSGLCFAD